MGLVETCSPRQHTSVDWTRKMDLQGLGLIDFMCWATMAVPSNNGQCATATQGYQTDSNESCRVLDTMPLTF